MRNFINVIIFSLLVMGGYVLFATAYIPKINPSPPPAEEALDVGSMTMEKFIALGEGIFNGKGTCTLCHNPVVKRAPLLEGIASRAMERIKDPRYKGTAKNVEEYIYESMTKPSMYVVGGYGVKGTNDTQSPMPVVTSGAIGLSEVEVRAVIAYLQNIAGTEVTVEIPKGGSMGDKKEAQAMAPPAKTVEEAVEKFGCGVCHRIAGQQGTIGPDLTKIGSKRNIEYLIRAILDPNADIAKGFPPGIMPQDFKDRMTAGELQLIVNYLAKSR